MIEHKTCAYYLKCTLYNPQSPRYCVALNDTNTKAKHCFLSFYALITKVVRKRVTNICKFTI